VQKSNSGQRTNLLKTRRKKKKKKKGCSLNINLNVTFFGSSTTRFKKRVSQFIDQTQQNKQPNKQTNQEEGKSDGREEVLHLAVFSQNRITLAPPIELAQPVREQSATLKAEMANKQCNWMVPCAPEDFFPKKTR
jgi:hypothetical protein